MFCCRTILQSGAAATTTKVATAFGVRHSRSFGKYFSSFNSENQKSSPSQDNDHRHQTPPQPPQPPHHHRQQAGFSISAPIEDFLLRSGLTKDEDLARFFAKAATGTLYSMLGITVLGTLGVDTKPLITGIGITGFAVGFAVKEIATNFLSGILLVFTKPFNKGQYLRVMSSPMLEGVVESIDARYVFLRSRDKGVLMIPAIVVYTNPILVLNSAPYLASTNTTSITSSTSAAPTTPSS